MTVQLSEELHWIEECYDLGGEHKHVSVYLLRDDDASVLVDSGAFHDRDAIVERVAEAPGGGEPVDALVLSHSDYPHAANVREFVGPGSELVWLRDVDPEQLRAALESILGRFDVSWVAPIHGHPIAGEDLDRYLDRLIDAAERIAGEYEVPS